MTPSQNSNQPVNKNQMESDPNGLENVNQPILAQTLAEFLNSPSPLDEETIKEVLEITKSYLKYGGNFYMHLTGKDPQLEKHVDYKLRYDRIGSGEVDMTSYAEARQRKVDLWRADPENQLLLKSAEEFHESHRHEISYGHEAITLQNASGSPEVKSRFTTNLFYSDNWLYYESNRFDKQTQKFSQPERERNLYRIYLSLPSSEIFSTFKEIIDTLKGSEQIMKYGFQIKTLDLHRTDSIELSKVMYQKDKMVLYLGEKSMEAAFPLLQKYIDDNRSKLSLPGVLFAKPMIDSRGIPVSGIRVTSSAKGISPDPNMVPSEYQTFNDMQSCIIQSCFKSIVAALKKPSLMLAMTAPFPKVRWEMERISPQASTENYLKKILDQPEGDNFLSKYFKQVYPQWATAYGLRENNTAFKVN